MDKIILTFFIPYYVSISNTSCVLSFVSNLCMVWYARHIIFQPVASHFRVEITKDLKNMGALAGFVPIHREI